MADNPPASAEQVPATKGTCFVISPIGAEGSSVRKHMDDVFFCIIKPACDRRRFEAVRGDHKARPGRITNHIVRSILEDPLIICVLTGANPNVYYELAIAESAGRPIIVLKQRDEPIPFDVKDVRIIEYDLDPRNIYAETYVDQICEAIDILEQEGLEKRVVPFAPAISPLNAAPWNFQIAQEYRDLSARYVLEIARNAQNQFDFCGIALKGWAFNEGLFDILKKRGESNLPVRILMMDESNPALGQMLQSAYSEDIDRLREDIRVAWGRWGVLAAQHPSIQVQKVRRGLIYQQAAINDFEMVWTPHLVKFTTGESPAIRVDRQRAQGELNSAGGMHYLLSAMQKEFDHLWSTNRPTPVRLDAPNATRQPATAKKAPRRNGKEPRIEQPGGKKA